jgi:hypothetical protein
MMSEENEESDNQSDNGEPHVKRSRMSTSLSPEDTQNNFFYQGIICKLINILLSNEPNLDLIKPLLTKYQDSIQKYVAGRIKELDDELVGLQAQLTGLQTAIQRQLVSQEILLQQEQLKEKIDLTTKNRDLINRFYNFFTDRQTGLDAILANRQNIIETLVQLLNNVKDLFCPEDGSYTIDNACDQIGNAHDQKLLCNLFNELCETNDYILPVLNQGTSNDPFVEVAEFLNTLQQSMDVAKKKGKKSKKPPETQVSLKEHFNKMMMIYKENEVILKNELTGLLQTSNDFVDPPMKALLYFLFINFSDTPDKMWLGSVVELFYVFSDSITNFCASENGNKVRDNNYIALIRSLYYDVFCNTDLKLQQQQQQQQPFVKFMDDNLNTFTIVLTPEIDQKRGIVLIPHFIGVLVMLMTEINHDFESITIKEKKENKKAVDLKFIKEMVRFLLKEYATEALSTIAEQLTPVVDIIGKINYFFDTESNIFVYLNEENCQSMMLEIYNLKKIICVQEVPNGTKVLSRPEKIISPFPAVLAKNKNVILSADAKNTLGISINSIAKLYKLKKEEHPFLNFDAGNASNIEEQEEAGMEAAMSVNDTPTTLKELTTGNPISYNIDVCDLWGQNVFRIVMYQDNSPWMFSLVFPTNRDASTQLNRTLNTICGQLNDNLGSFADVSITKVASLYNSAYGIITKQVKNFQNTNNHGLKKALYNILVSIISLKSMGDLLTYYVTLIEGVENLKTNPNYDVKKEYIGVVSSADFSLMQLPLVKIMRLVPSQTEPQFIPYVPPCSLFASVHIKGSEYVVPLNDEERFKIVLWEYISNRYSIGSNINFDYVRYFIDYFYDIYWGKLFPDSISDKISMLGIATSFTKIDDEFCKFLKSNLTDDTDNYKKQMLNHAICECESFNKFNDSWNSGLYNQICDLLKSFYRSITPCFEDCNEKYEINNSCGLYFSNNEFYIKYLNNDPKNKNINENYYKGEIQVLEGQQSINITFDDEDTANNVDTSRIKRIFDFSKSIRPQDAKMYSLAEYGVYCVPQTNTNSASTMAQDGDDDDDLGGGNGKKFIGNKNTKTYKKKYIKNKINKTYGNKNINNKMNNTRSNKKLNKKHTNTLRKK